MGIVLNEREWAENAIAERNLGKRPSETLNRVAKYYFQCEKYKKSEVREKLEDFLLKCDPNIILVKWADAIDRAVRAADKYPLIHIDSVGITRGEMETIHSLPGKQSRKLAFTMLCVAKYWDAVQPKNNGWVNTQDREVMAMANISTSIKRQNELLHEMRNMGLIGFSKRVDSLNIQVLFMDDTEVCVGISDFRNLGNQYSLQCGEPFFQCAQCGLTIRKKNNAHKYCPQCAAEMYIRKSVASVARQRTAADRSAG